ncbi:MAG TPA: FG-GAP-like repeat-containing protein [Pyrinomonadaceae bacterium]|jgi:outer membrane protein assembly factor BamB|nr:FG-GAP-like repeat-containing protein [Pyrinomonadaceae bacterium]
MKQTLRPSLALSLLVACACLTLAPTSSAQRRRPRPPRTPPATTQTQETTQPARTGEAQTASTSILIRWRGTADVERYRLQVARDAEFNDIVFDSAVTGREHRVTGLAPGSYFWHVAPAAGETGRYSSPAPIQVVAGPASAGATVATPTAANVIIASNNVGWRTATGEVARLAAANLRAGKGADFVGVNTGGTVYALDGATGVALWVTRFRPGAAGGGQANAEANATTAVTFPPLVVRAGETSNIVAAYEGGVRALRGETGREVWRAALGAGSAVSGITFDFDGDGKTEIVVAAGSPSTLYILDSETGRTLAETKLEGNVVGSPAPYTSAAMRGVVVSLDNSTVDLRNIKGESVKSVKLDAPVTTAPLVIPSSHGLIMTVGTEKGLDALNADELRPIGRIATEGDTVRGTLVGSDLDGDGMQEIIMVTRQGRVAVVGTGDGKIKWFAEGATDASAASLADVNGDGVLDVLVPAGSLFAVGFSGRDGSLIWRAEEDGGRPLPPRPADSMRSLTVAPATGDGGFVVGGEPSRVGLRAVELPKGAVKTAAN